MERLLYLWDHLDDLAGTVRHVALTFWHQIRTPP